jgi:hypothetical protein
MIIVDYIHIMIIILSKEHGLLIDLGNGSHARFAKPSLEASNETLCFKAFCNAKEQ